MKYVFMEHGRSLEHYLQKELNRHVIEVAFRTTNETKNVHLLKPNFTYYDNNKCS